WKRSRAEGGGVLLDLGSHHFDLVLWLLDAEVEHVDALVRSDETDQDSATVRLSLDGGRTVSSFFSFRAAKAHSLELYGDRGVIRIDRGARTLSLLGARGRVITPSVLSWRARTVVRRNSEPSW